MGINYRTAWLLSNIAINSGSLAGRVDFSRMMTLGRQSFSLRKTECERLFKSCPGIISDSQKAQFYRDLKNSSPPRLPNTRYCEPFIKLLQKNDEGIIDSLDYSDYEGATVIQDITVPIGSELKNKYTCVLDGGLLEHVFNYQVAIKNAMDMVAVGGHLVILTPGNNWFGHGFYQFSPELFYSVLRKKNGFTNTRVYLNNGGKWYLAANPRAIRQRAELHLNWPNLSLYVISTKVAEAPDKLTVYQSDYEQIWASKENALDEGPGFMPLLKEIYHQLPPNIAEHSFNLYNKANGRRKFKKLFRPVNFNQ